MKTTLFIKHWINLALTPQVDRMMDVEGIKGYGAYLYILEKLFLVQLEQTPLIFLKSIVRKGISYSYLRRFVLESGLFVIEGDYFYAPELKQQLHDMEESALKKNKKTTNIDAKEAQNDDITSDFDTEIVRREEIKLQHAKKDDANLSESDKFDSEKCNFNTQISRNGNDFPVNNTLNYTRIDNNNSSSSPYRIEEKKIREKNISSSEKRLSTTKVSFSDDAVDYLLKLREVNYRLPWERYVKEMSMDTSWLLSVFVQHKNNFTLQGHIPEIIQLFRRQIIDQGKENDMISLHKVKLYFANYTKKKLSNNQTLKDLINSLEREMNIAPY